MTRAITILAAAVAGGCGDGGSTEPAGQSTQVDLAARQLERGNAAFSQFQQLYDSWEFDESAPAKIRLMEERLHAVGDATTALGKMSATTLKKAGAVDDVRRWISVVEGRAFDYERMKQLSSDLPPYEYEDSGTNEYEDPDTTNEFGEGY